MSPGTSVFTAMATYSKEAGILIEQAEDEIAAVNMAVAGWYAGARPIVSTSGGGFALMSEGMSLAGMTETPLVIHIAQRPGPATGLPTRTEQGDLNLALHAGHGIFARAIYAPGTTQKAFELAFRAFNHADQYQIPVIILTDQYFVDTYYDTPEFDLEKIKVEKHMVETDDNYRRYKITDSGISPRGIPGFGTGFVCSDSDEHDE
ncbi:MAG: 2-oxoacid:acceptor oxidoreductase subunit alpha, partial [Spirochaetaceae bacterium]|nr:2-oxoacid:acceptor oxidoreductase subunit alpha [Spirochaetaceae bacterium]